MKRVGMQFVGIGLASLTVALGPGHAFADAPKASRGFQLGLRTGASVPFGQATRDLDLADFSSVQVPLLVEIGGKPLRELFLGGYFGFGVGGPSGSTADTCDRVDAGCAGFSWRIGAEIQYHIIPRGEINPWVGYGFGYEATSLGMGLEGREEVDRDAVIVSALAGWEFAHLMGGADFRLSRVVGLGPVVDLSFGRYKLVGLATDEGRTAGESIANYDEANHGWFTFGIRVVFFP